MSQEVSPSLLNLRGFRFQKKPTMSQNNSCLEATCKCIFEDFYQNLLFYSASERSPQKVVIRRRIVPILDSDSDCDTVGNKGAPIAMNGQSNKVTEKEQQMRYLIKMFPKMQSFVCFFFSQ